MDDTHIADTENTVGELYRDSAVAQGYVAQRFRWSWSRLLHNTQVGVVERHLCHENDDSVLEIAPGPARIAVDLMGVKRGVMVDYSPQMLEVASQRLEEFGKRQFWTVRDGNAFDLQELSEMFRFVYAFRLIRHFREPDRIRIYQSVRSALEDGGLFVLDVVGKKMRSQLDLQRKRSEGSLDVYDVSYTESDFRSEMNNNGFDVIAMRPIVRHFPLQRMISHRLDRRMPFLSKSIVGALERMPSRAPLEWIAVCRKF